MSDEIIDVFVNKLVREKIKSPTRPDFSLDKWNREWAKVEAIASERDKKVHTMGVIIDSVLKDVRTKLTELYTMAPKTTYEKLMISYIASSNRTSVVALKSAKEMQGLNAKEILLTTNKMGNKQSLGEVAHGAVDGFQLAIRQCLKGIEGNENVILSPKPINEMEFVHREGWLSQLYWTYLHLWQCVIWGGYDLIEVDRVNKIFRIEQPNTVSEISFMNSSERKESLSVQSAMIAMQARISAHFSNDKYIIVTRGNKKRVAKVALIRNAEHELITLNAQWRISKFELEDYFPEKWLNDDYGKGFCLSDALDVMRCLMLIANSENRKYPENDSAFNVNKLREFCPSIDSTSLVRALCDATGARATKVDKIIDFLTFNSSPKSDLWCQPLIKIKGNKFVLVTSALSSPMMFRVFERWVELFDIDISEKGITYENKVAEELNDALQNNSIIVDYDKAISKRIRIESMEEEFDLLARIDDLILIGEAKSIVTTDSEISKYRTSEILHHAGEQVVRKSKFLENNLRVVFERLNWTYDPSKNYKFAKFIINSSRIFVGHSFSNIPVIDEKILKSFFTSNEINLMSVVSRDEMKSIAWYRLYDNIEELKVNFHKYISSPPQLNTGVNQYEYNEIVFPYMGKDSFKISKKYLILKKSGPLAPMEQEHNFPVIKSPDFEHEASQINVRF